MMGMPTWRLLNADCPVVSLSCSKRQVRDMRARHFGSSVTEYPPAKSLAHGATPFLVQCTD